MSTTWQTPPEQPDPGAEPPAPEEPASEPARTGERAWEPWSAPVALLVALAVSFVGGLVVFVVAAAVGAADLDDTPPGVLLGGTLVQDIGFVAAAIFFARMTGPVWAAQFGLRGTSFWRAVGWILVLYVAFVVFAGIWSQLVKIEEDDVLDQFGTKDSDLLLVLTGLMVCVVAPVVEEFFFRGFFFTALRNWRGLWPAAIGTGVLFGAIHLASSPIGAIVPLMVFGIGLCLLYAKTGSLYPCIAVHAINNAIAFSALNDWEWQIPLVVLGALALCALVTFPIARLWRPPAASTAPPAVPAPA